MAEGEVGRLYVTIGGRLDDLQKSLGQAQQKLEAFGARMQTVGRTMTMGLTLPIIAGMTLAVKAAMEQEEATNTLRASLADLGAETEGMVTKLSEFASAMQKATVYGDESIQMAMAYGKNLGITADKLEAATKAAIGLAARFKLDLNTAMMLVGRASQGQTQMLTRYGIVLGDNLTDQEKFNKLLEIGADSFGLAEAETRTFTGGMKQLKNAIGDVQEQFGEVLLPMLKGLVERLKSLVAWLDKLPEGTKRATVYMAGFVALLGPALMSIGSMARGIGVLRVALTALSAHPIVRVLLLAVTALTALVALLRKVWQQVPELRNAFGELTAKLSDLWAVVKAELWPAVKDLAAKLWDLAKPAVIAQLKLVTAILEGWAKNLAEVVGWVTQAVEWFTKLLGIAPKATAAKPAESKPAATEQSATGEITDLEVVETTEDVNRALDEQKQKLEAIAREREQIAREIERQHDAELAALRSVQADKLRLIGREYDAQRAEAKAAFDAEATQLARKLIAGEQVLNQMQAARARYGMTIRAIDQSEAAEQARIAEELYRRKVTLWKELERIALDSQERQASAMQSAADKMRGLAERLHDRLVGLAYGETAVKLAQLDRQQAAEEAAAREMFGDTGALEQALSLISDDYDLQRQELHDAEGERHEEKLGWIEELKRVQWTDVTSAWRRAVEAGAQMQLRATPAFDQTVNQSAMMDMRPVDSKLASLNEYMSRNERIVSESEQELKRIRQLAEVLVGG